VGRLGSPKSSPFLWTGERGTAKVRQQYSFGAFLYRLVDYTTVI
jgi:hypothetical protein